MAPVSFLRLLQFADGLFPSGGHAHSMGLEWFVQSGRVKDAAGVRKFLSVYLEGTAGPCDAVAVVAARAAGGTRKVEACLDLDRLLDAMKPAKELREASGQMGRQTLRVAVAVIEDRLLRMFDRSVNQQETHGHHAVVFGLVAHALFWSPEAAALAFLYSTASLLVSAALRLLALGQVEAQRLLWETGPLIERLALEAKDKGAEDLASFAPSMEIAAMQHAGLGARLFRS